MTHRNMSTLGFLIALLAFSSLSRSATPEAVTFPTFGISYTAPPDAVFDLTDSPTPIGIYSFNKDTPNAGAAILLEATAAKGQSLFFLSGSITTKMGGTVASGSFTIGGEEAEKITSDIKEGSYTNRITYVVVHQDRLYVMSALNSVSANAAKPLDDLIASVQFIPVESPLKNMKDLFDKPFEVFGCFSMNGPKCLRRTDNTSTLLHLEIHDFTTDSNPFNVDLQRIQIPAPKTFADIRDAYSAGLQKNLNAPASLVWSTPQIPGLNVSNPIKSSLKLPDGSVVTSTQRFCILELAPGDFVQILFSIADMPDADAKAYIELSDSMLASIKLLPSSKAAKP